MQCAIVHTYACAILHYAGHSDDLKLMYLHVAWAHMKDNILTLALGHFCQ